MSDSDYAIPFGWSVIQYYSGPIDGWIQYYENQQTGQCWWLCGNFWRVWDGTHWAWTQHRHHVVRRDLIFAIVLTVSLFVVLVGLFGPIAIIFCLLVGAGWMALGGFNYFLRNRHPQAFRAFAVAQTALGAKRVYDMTHRSYH